MKTIERAHTPRDLWERVKLNPNMLRSLEQIDRHLAYWPKYLVNTAKRRLARIHQYLIRMRRAQSKLRLELVPVSAHKERMERRKEEKAHQAANIQDSIKQELLQRLRSGTYGELYDGIVNFPQREFEDAVEDLEDLDAALDADAFVEAYDEDEEEEEDVEEEREVEYEYEMEGPVRQRAGQQQTQRAGKRAAATADSDDDDDDVDSDDDDDDDDDDEEDDAPVPCEAPKLSFAERARAARAGVKIATPAAAKPAAVAAKPAAAAAPVGKRARKAHVSLEDSE
jgi:protein MAK16